MKTINKEIQSEILMITMKEIVPENSLFLGIPFGHDTPHLVKTMKEDLKIQINICIKKPLEKSRGLSTL